MTLWIFFKTNPWFNACLKFPMWITYSVSLCHFSIFIHSGKSGESLWSPCNFLIYLTLTSRKYPPLLSSLEFFMNSSLNWEVYFIHILFHHYIPVSNMWRFFIFITIFHVFVINLCILINRVTYSSCYTFFYHY